MNRNLQKSKKPLLIGITGGIGAGKSLISHIFSVLGVPVFNADLQAQNILKTDAEARRKIIQLFGEDAYIDTEPNRPLLAKKIFADEGLREALNGIVHPAVAKAFAKWVELHSDKPYLLKEAAILFETGTYKDLDATILITAPEEIRIQRVITRDGASREMVLERMKAQWPDSQKRPLSDYIIHNDNNHPVIPAVLKIHHSISNLSS